MNTLGCGFVSCDRRDRPILGCNDCKRWFCDLHVNNHVCTNDPLDLRCPTCGADPAAKLPAPAGLTAAQEIRGIALRAAVKLVIPIEPDVTEDEPQDGVEGPIRDALLVAGRFAAWITDEPDTAACPDPALHQRLDTFVARPDALVRDLANWIVDNIPGEPSRSEGAIATAIRVMADLKAERDKAIAELQQADAELGAEIDRVEAANTRICAERDALRQAEMEHAADLEASRAREQIAAERVTKVLALCVTHERHGGGLDPGQVRAILAGNQDEETT